MNLGSSVHTASSDDVVSLSMSGGDVISASPAALRLISQCSETLDWESVRRCFAERFPGFPETPADANPKALTAADPPSDPAVLDISGTADALTLSLSDPRQGARAWHEAFMQGRKAQQLTHLSEHAPHPIWTVDHTGAVVWANPAYWALCDACAGTETVPQLLSNPASLPFTDAATQVRTPVPGSRGTPDMWFDVARSVLEDRTTYYATDVTAIVRAEAAQRNFVQTLAKTFAHLSIGLAIFDRDKQLALFNPALVDLTDLSPEFLSKRPNLLSFFDSLREKQVMPEPKNYSGWRETLADVVVAARDGRYSETWNLPSGLTYRVTGRPHPDGAIAFLFEDISAEISLTRRFREELEVGHAVLDTMDSAIAVFAPSGRMTFSNTGYADLWQTTTESQIMDVTIADATSAWASQCLPTPAWSDIRDLVVSYGARETWHATVQRSDGRGLTCTVEPLTGGATLVRFDLAEARTPAQSVPLKA
ncbi:PAS-domain containing protein [Pseudaestuariivita sp.]|uniref:PAS-domain containing protein n=1 Tax=Pseudaestuariivita sp. TaxID=2211669 RepID=UPI0040581770